MSKERAFVRYTKAGKIVPGSLILTQGSYPNGPGLWKEITTDLCCENNNTMNYKVYTALLTQSGTDAPTVATVFENTIGNITWTRPISDGIYVANLAGAFTANKTYINCWLNYSTCAAVFANCSLQTGVTQEDECFFYTYSDFASNPGTVLIDLGGDGLFVEIRVYP